MCPVKSRDSAGSLRCQFARAPERENQLPRLGTTRAPEPPAFTLHTRALLAAPILCRCDRCAVPCLLNVIVTLHPERALSVARPTGQSGQTQSHVPAATVATPCVSARVCTGASQPRVKVCVGMPPLCSEPAAATPLCHYHCRVCCCTPRKKVPPPSGWCPAIGAATLSEASAESRRVPRAASLLGSPFAT